MPAGKYNLTIEQGSSFYRTLHFVEDDGVTPIDKSGLSYAGQIRRTPESTLVEASFAFDLTNIKAGVVIMYLLATQTTALTSTKGADLSVYDVEESDALTHEPTFRILQGTVKVTPEVTHNV